MNKKVYHPDFDNHMDQSKQSDSEKAKATQEAEAASTAAAADEKTVAGSDHTVSIKEMLEQEDKEDQIRD